MAKPLENAYDPTDSNVLEDILKTNASRRRPAPLVTENTNTETPGGTPPYAAEPHSADNPTGYTDNSKAIQTDGYPSGHIDDKTARQQDSKTPDNTDSHLVSHPTTHGDDKIVIHPPGNKTRQPNNKTAGQQDDKISSPSPQRLHWRDVQVSEAPRILVSFRIPEPLNDWIEDYVHAHRKEGVAKQDVLAWAIGVLQQQVAAEEGC